MKSKDTLKIPITFFGRWIKQLGGSSVIAAALASLLCLTGCGSAPVTFKYTTETPSKLSDWGVLGVRDGRVFVDADTVVYTLASPLFSDHALKFRTINVPEGRTVAVTDSGRFDYPVGTVITKTFFYKTMEAYSDDGQPRFMAVSDIPTPTPNDLREIELDKVQLIETRLLVRRAAGWQALPYRWRADQTDAELLPAGDLLLAEIVFEDQSEASFAYLVPNQNQCAGCHVLDQSTKAIEPIGPHQKHLQRVTGPNQLDEWSSRGLVDTEHLRGDLAWTQIDYRDERHTLNDRARSYLDINCGHCHSATGPADTSGLYLNGETLDRVRLGWCKAPIAAGQGTGGHQYGIVPGHPERSILYYRMQSRDPGAMMPELGRNLLDKAGSALVASWIGDMEPTPCQGEGIPAIGSQLGTSDLASVDHHAHELISTQEE